MNGNLLDVLVDRNIVTEETEFAAQFNAVDISGISRRQIEGIYTYVGHTSDDNGIGMMIGVSIRDGHQVSFPLSKINSLDGMDAERFASIYGLSSVGTPIKMAARRGRKPKNRAA